MFFASSISFILPLWAYGIRFNDLKGWISHLVVDESVASAVSNLISLDVLEIWILFLTLLV